MVRISASVAPEGTQTTILMAGEKSLRRRFRRLRETPEGDGAFQRDRRVRVRDRRGRAVPDHVDQARLLPRRAPGIRRVSAQKVRDRRKSAQGVESARCDV